MKSFNEIYEEIYKQSNEELEAIRKSKTKRVAIIALVVLLIVFFILIKLGSYGNGIMYFFPFIIIAILIIIISLTAFNKIKFTSTFKQKVIAPFVKNVDKNLNYIPEKGMPSLIYRQGEFESFDDYYSEDLIEGILDGKYAVKMAEVHTEDESTDSEGNTTTTTLFHGIFGYVECAKSIQTSIKVHSDHGFLGNLFKGKTKIEMDSADFEKYFDVYGEDKIKAMQILTSDVMAMMIDFRQESKIKYEMTVKNNQMYIRFHTGSVFEPKLFKDSLDYNMLKKYYDIINFIFKVSRGINKAIEETEI